ncbi:MAG TPA: hypothetical protein DCG19_05970 [Cryomorphaceae bacterium]|nr:hypothetical protein [Owenweeksia sp.]MBF98182.1 hypothetical protein [Owenweeksia sp.]HAD96933.1 hypothetical protein [Cryomorphaceae bacterium]HBF21383.1 hypothetical protein [Cryomorphaceae bacterium]
MLSLIVLCSSMHFRIDTHTCMGNLVGLAIFGEAERCSHHDQEAEGPKHHSKFEAPSEEEKSCCEDKEFCIEGIDVQTHQQNNTLLTAPLFAFVVNKPAMLSAVGINFAYIQPHYLNYKPPLIEVDLPIHLQTFLI